MSVTEDRLGLLVDAIADYAIFVLDPAGRVQSWNTGARAITGWCADEVLGRSFEQFYTEPDRRAGKPAQLLAEASAKGRVEDQGERVRKDGTTFWADVVITALRDAAGELLGFGEVARDVTERRKAEQARLELARAIDLRDDFLAIASHELKTPLTSMHLVLEGMRRQLEDPDQVARFERAIDANLKLSALVDSLLDAGAMAAGQLVLKRAPGDLAAIVTAAVVIFRPTAQSHGCRLDARIAGPVPGDWDGVRVGQVVTNLLGNAAKYGAHAPITLQLTNDGQHARLTVRDHGPGIAPADRERVFGRFEHGTGFRDWGGLGLGLFAARKIVEGHGGTISAHEAPGGGTLLVVQVPVSRAS